VAGDRIGKNDGSQESSMAPSASDSHEHLMTAMYELTIGVSLVAVGGGWLTDCDCHVTLSTVERGVVGGQQHHIVDSIPSSIHNITHSTSGGLHFTIITSATTCCNTLPQLDSKSFTLVGLGC
jgi:hypothetical protein